MTGPIVRIALRYLSGFLIARGLVTEDGAWLFSDADFVSVAEAVVGFAVATFTEVYYYLARKFGWSK